MAPIARSAGIRRGVCYQTCPIAHDGLDYITYSKGNEAIIDFKASASPPPTPARA